MQIPRCASVNAREQIASGRKGCHNDVPEFAFRDTQEVVSTYWTFRGQNAHKLVASVVGAKTSINILQLK
jgi:hypothetical protein